ncbi:hypothetical protein [Natrinema sp. SYSU A 869]|uniref:DUF7544 domain-containing protein n=1 Tax=Natrinema sp. SYSU A 869 TaxID=2871694 RepID=UPI00210652ED|nr:hypothetical protein [Natrinema sp. SYSU A 869]
MDAIDDLGDAIDVTRNRLTPVRTGTWLRLALIVFFVSSLGLSGPMIPSGDTGMVTDDPTVEEQRPQELEGIATDELVFWALVVVAIVLVLWLLYEFIAAVMEFVFLESLRSSEVHVRRYFAGNFGKGCGCSCFDSVSECCLRFSGSSRLRPSCSRWSRASTGSWRACSCSTSSMRSSWWCSIPS